MAPTTEGVRQLPHPPAAAGRDLSPCLRRHASLLLALLLGGAAILGPILLVRDGLVPLIDAGFHPGQAWLSACRRAGIFAGVLAGYWVYVRMAERRAATELRLQPHRIATAALGGCLMVGLPITLLFALGAYRIVQWHGVSSALWSVAALIGIAATLEELVCRVLLLRVLERAWGTLPALVVQALLFALRHLENVAHAGPSDVARMLVTVTVLGLFWGGVFVLTRNLWTGAAHHATWNFTILLSGVPLSGNDDWRALAPLHSLYAGPDWLTGGMFGPESSWLVIATSALATAQLLRFAWRRGAFRAAGDPIATG